MPVGARQDLGSKQSGFSLTSPSAFAAFGCTSSISVKSEHSSSCLVAERFVLIQGLRRQAEQYAIKGLGDLVLGQGTIQSLQEKYLDVTEKSGGTPCDSCSFPTVRRQATSE